MNRKPCVSGKFYPDNKEELIKLIESYIDTNTKKINSIGCVCPHAGYVYSGAVAGAVFSSMKISDTYIVLCPNHTGLGHNFSLSLETWETPLGEICIDEDISNEILDALDFVKEDTLAHKNEHSLEVQIPFIQFVNPNARIVPMCISSFDISKLILLGQKLSQIIKSTDKKVCIIASSDMTHYEPHDIAMQKDEIAIKNILDLDEKGLINDVTTYNITMCGVIPTVILIITAKKSGFNKANLVKYHTSGDIFGDYSQVVGYAGIVCH